MKNLQNKALWVVVGVLGLASLVGVVSAYSGGTPKVVVEGDYIEAGQSGQSEQVVGGSYTSEPTWLTASDEWQAINSIYGYGDVEIDGTAYFDGAVDFLGAINSRETQSALTGTTTLAATDSGETFLISGGYSTWTLPATSSLQAGTKFMFRVGGDLTVTSTIVTASSWNGIEGALIVAGAVVDCDAEDTLNIGSELTDIGDYVELIWSGTNWLIGDSGFVTAASITCTAT